MLTPKNLKHRKQHKQISRIKGAAHAGNKVTSGEFGLKALEGERITSRQIEASRRAIVRFLRRRGKLLITIFPDLPVSTKPAEVRMGKGKGSPDYYVAPVKAGRVMFELEGVAEEDAREAFRLAAQKLPIKTKFVKRLIA